MSFMEIGLFQLENLATTPARFVFLDVRAIPKPVHPQLDALLKKSSAIARSDVKDRLRDADKKQPVLLVDEDGSLAAALAAELTADGFENVYVIMGGVAGLLSEL